MITSILVLNNNSKSLDHKLFMYNEFSECVEWRINLENTERFSLVHGGVAMDNSCQINIYHGTFLEHLNYYIFMKFVLIRKHTT